jgi:hypothetical protein
LEHPNKPWLWNWISFNSNIKMKDILEHPDLNWDWDYVSCNPNIKMKDVLEHPDKPWNWNSISYNHFGWKREPSEREKQEGAKRVADLCREHIMQWCWNPDTVLGRYLVEQEMMELYEE